MGPVRTEKPTARKSSSSNSISDPSKRRFKRPNTDADSSSVSTGVQKIKAAIRQTKRLLAKEKLAADVRVTTERKLKSLEADLTKAESNRKERTLSTRYHKVKFFERQKVVRKINQTKKKLSEATASSSRQTLETELYEHRVELNYINHYPKTKKYISLFPPEVRNKSSSEVTADPSSAESNEEREGIKKWVREQMEAGTLPDEPEDAQRSQNEWKQTEYTKGKKATNEQSADAEGEPEEKDDFFENDEESGDDD
ncbi:hypothetical protein BT96DRAFT_968368 [Gymnopus androsaceus JB14]|uniref:rRNA-processing protein EFG1 n=1 Tax=Gymnopus androsaceus JB14 TaxID=1447944 RepID=A0A6A4GKK8_9AGAR|nr:hypothetical protein BT96DRAFT_968368 [Gymnopus androsaceus JB14]